MLILSLAWRNIWRNPLRSLVIMCSIALGLLAGLAVLSLYKGMMNSRIQTVIEEEVGHMQMHHPEFKKDYNPSYVIDSLDEVLSIVERDPRVRLITTRQVIQGMISTTSGSHPISLLGVNPEAEYRFSKLKTKLLEGPGFQDHRENEIIIGKKLASKIHSKIGSKVVVMFSDTSNNIVSAAYTVRGIYQSSNSPLDERLVYLKQTELNHLLGELNAVQELAIILHSNDSLEQVKQEYKQRFAHLDIESWMEISPETNLMVDTVDVYAYIIMIIIMFALSFGIINTMLMAVMERTREWGMLMAVGMAKFRVFVLILFETTVLSLAGSPFGIAAAWLIISYFNKNGLDLSGMGEEMMSNYGFRPMIYPEFPAERILSTLFIVFITAILSSLIPALKALSLKPIVALRS